ncbi:uncharacterized protein [Gossypium hirsutum]|uniref:Uncharacterized protein n=1 Tax=Gossypium hirsutum TaxID=3635 RepID=A0A1U8J9I0_GOSHI|nr:uncharacterized protein LOC107903423 [Gossypium hirsutum]
MGNFNRYNNNPYSITYNSRWKQHLNFSWSNQWVGNSNNAIRQNIASAPHGYNQPMLWQNAQQNLALSSSSLEDLLNKYMAKNDVIIQIQVASLQAVENQVGKIAKALSLRPKEALHSDTENSRFQGKEQCEYITFRSCTQLLGVVNDTTNEEDMVEKLLEVFMDDFSVFGDTFEDCLKNLELVLYRCEETNLVLNWEKCYFMEFNLEIRDRKGTENQVADHLSRIEARSEYGNIQRIQDDFPDKQLLVAIALPWYADMVGTSHALISDEGLHFDCKLVANI